MPLKMLPGTKSSPSYLARNGDVPRCSSGIALVVFPAMEQPWLDAIGDMPPAVQTVLLELSERFTRDAVLESVEQSRAELTPLRMLEQHAQGGRDGA